MSKFSKGETSAAKRNEREIKTRSLIKKIALIRGALSKHSKIDSLDALKSRRGTIPIKAALSWSDVNLEITSCSYNTSQEPYNVEYTKALSAILVDYTSELKPSGENSNRKAPTTKETLKDVRYWKNECEQLKNALAEVFRAYEQLRFLSKKFKIEDIRYQQVLKNHNTVVSKARLTLVKK